MTNTKDARAERLAAALRENLRKRKTQDKAPPREKPHQAGVEK